MEMSKWVSFTHRGEVENYNEGVTSCCNKRLRKDVINRKKRIDKEQAYWGPSHVRQTPAACFRGPSSFYGSRCLNWDVAIYKQPKKKGTCI